MKISDKNWLKTHSVSKRFLQVDRYLHLKAEHSLNLHLDHSALQEVLGLYHNSKKDNALVAWLNPVAT